MNSRQYSYKLLTSYQARLHQNIT